MSQPLSWLQGQTTPPPEPLRTSVTVIERVEAEAPARVTTLGVEDVQRQPGINLDDRLRAVPGFSLFRRTSSLVANPTTQGVSLRGLGSSGASRTLVLWDGVPLNDPFGGWVYWNRAAADELQRIEISRGAPTSVFGDRAMSGTIALFSRPTESRVWGGYQGGNRATHLLSGGAGHRWGNLGASIHARGATTDGYYVVRRDRRGLADTPANVRFASGNTRLDWSRQADRLFLRLDMLAEDRDNGTVLTRNSTSLGTIASNYSRQWTADTLSVLAYHTREEYRATFSAVSADRNTERLTSTQTVPSDATGAAGIWSRRGSSWNVLAGADMQHVQGVSTDRLVPTGVRVGEGSQWQHGTFAQTDAWAGPVKLFLGARHQFAGDERLWSPSGGFAAGRGALRVRGSAYRAFRAPTLNELYRPFRVGNAETRANPNLRPETMFGAEAGVDYTGEVARFSVSLFRNKLEDVVTNVTLSSQPNLIVRERQNAASATSRGIDADLRLRWRDWTAEAGYLFAESRFSTRERIPQTPKHAGTAQLTWAHGATFISGGLRAFGLQFEDDRNQFVLPGFTTVQLAASQGVGAGLTLVLEVENLTGREFVTGYTPVPLTGAPRLWRAGLRWNRPFRP